LRLTLVANDADDRPLFATAVVWGEAQLADAFDNVLDLAFGGIRTDNDNHGSNREKG
jgi:hypothetical protein